MMSKGEREVVGQARRGCTGVERGWIERQYAEPGDGIEEDAGQARGTS